MKSHFWLARLVCLATCMASGLASAQTVTATTGAINGVVIDSSRGVVPGVQVTVSSASLMTPQTVTTDATGAFRFSAVPPGDYTLVFELRGFSRVVREAVRVALGFTATLDVELTPGNVTDSVSVVGTPVIDLASTEVVAHFDSERLASLPGARDIFAVLSNTPGVAMLKMDVGGNGGLAIQEFTAYGLRATTGIHRNEVEGIRVGGANGANDNYFSDFASFSEIAIKAVGNSASMPVPGMMAQYVSKSGGNAYRGALYADYQSDRWEATNIDDALIARGLAGGPALDVHDVNRLQHFRDFTVDQGGYLKKDRAWWYGAYRNSEVAQRYAWLLDTSAILKANAATAKFTYNLTPRQKLVGYHQHEAFSQTSYFIAGTNQPIQASDALPTLSFPVDVWKVEYNAALSNSLYLEARAGNYVSDALGQFKSVEPRISDVGANTVRGGSIASQRIINRPQVNGSVSYMKSGWAGTHTFRGGGEYMLDLVESPVVGYGHACNCVSTLNNSVPAQVQFLLGPSVSKSDLVTAAAFIDDTWRLNRRITASLGLRLDRYQPGLPEQVGATGQAFPAIDRVLTFNNWGPRVGLSADLTGDGKTVFKAHYGKFWPYPGAIFTNAFNPNPALGWTRTHLWTNDANGNGHWDAGEEGAVIAVAGGAASTRLDPAIVNTSVHQINSYFEREVAAGLAVRTGVVVNAKRDPYGSINISRPLNAYSVPIEVVDAGPDGRPGTTDDGAALMASNLAPEAFATAPVNVTTNLPDSGSNYYTWEITATKRQSARWSMLASFTKTWSREAALGVGNDFTPNALINTVDGQDRFTTWQGKINATLDLPYDVRLAPVLRSQSGTPFARTFVRTLNYGTATIKAEPVGAERTPIVTVADLRTEKMFRTARARITGFFDVYNIFNTNAVQTLTSVSGASWLRPTAITGPRILRIGTRVEW